MDVVVTVVTTLVVQLPQETTKVVTTNKIANVQYNYFQISLHRTLFENDVIIDESGQRVLRN